MLWTHVFGQRVRLIGHHVRALRRETLVASHIIARHAAAIGPLDDGHRARRIADVFVVAGPLAGTHATGRLGPAELAAGEDVERFGIRVLWRPRVIPVPALATGAVDECLWYVGLRPARQVVHEEGILDRVTEPRAGRGGPVQRPVRVPLSARPPAVRPRADRNV